jgi:hypothetical protein
MISRRHPIPISKTGWNTIMTPPDYRQSMKRRVDSMLPYPFIGQFGQSTPWRILGLKRVFGIATLVFRKRTIYNGKPEVRIRYVHPEWFISAAGRA